MNAREEGPVSGGFTAEEEVLHGAGFAAISAGLAAGLGFEKACAAIEATDADLRRIIADDYLKVTIAQRHFQGTESIADIATSFGVAAERVESARREMLAEVAAASVDVFRRQGGMPPTPDPADSRRQILIALFVVGMVAGCYFLADRPAIIWARDLDRQLVAVFEKITVAGSATPHLIVLAVLYLVLRFSLRRATAAKRALFVIAAIVVSGVTVNLLKPIVARWRPEAFLADPSLYGFAFFKTARIHNSFPSGHAATSLAVACALALLFPRLRVLWLVAAAVVASSRVIIGEHYPGDVLAGAWFGVVITLALSRTAWFRDVLDSPGKPP